MDALVEQLRLEEQALEERLAAIRGLLAVYGGGRFIPAPPKPQEPLPSGSPPLDGLRLRDAISVYLRWAQDTGRDRITLGELEQALLSQNVTTFRGKPIAGKLAWKTITNSLGSPENSNTWQVDKHSDHYQRADLIGLKAKRKKTA